MSDIYVVLDGNRIIGASTKLQGAELLRANYAQRRASRALEPQSHEWFIVYDRCRIVNTELTED